MVTRTSKIKTLSEHLSYYICKMVSLTVRLSVWDRIKKLNAYICLFFTIWDNSEFKDWYIRPCFMYKQVWRPVYNKTNVKVCLGPHEHPHTINATFMCFFGVFLQRGIHRIAKKTNKIQTFGHMPRAVT